MIAIRLASYCKKPMPMACIALVVVVIVSAISASATTNLGHARRSTLSGTILHIIRVAPTLPYTDANGHQTLRPGDTYESWTDETDGLCKEVEKDWRGNIVMTGYEVVKAGGTIAISDIAGPTQPRFLNGTTTLHPPLINGHIPDGLWLSGEHSIAGMQAEYAGYLRQAGTNVVQSTLNGVVVRRFGFSSADGLKGTAWLNSAGLPVQVEAGNFRIPLITRFPAIEELPAGTLAPGFFEVPTAHAGANKRAA